MRPIDPCPWCGAKAIDITRHCDLAGFDQRQRYMCSGPTCHEWRDGDGPDPEAPRDVKFPDGRIEPLIVIARG